MTSDTSDRVRSLDEAVSHFEAHWIGPIAQENIWFTDNSPDFIDSIRRAAMSEIPKLDSKEPRRHPHQRRIGKGLLPRVAETLVNANSRLIGCQDFDQLYQIVDDLIGTERGIGPVTIYDIAERIALNRGIESNNVYLHAGAREGAQEVLSRSKGRFLHISQFPKPIQRLSGFQAESMLCIYKKTLKDLRMTGLADAPRPNMGSACWPGSSGIC